MLSELEGISLAPGDMVVVERGDLDGLLDALRVRDYRTIGPVARNGAIAYDEIRSTADLPAGWGDEQEGGAYRLKRRSDDALFGFAVGPQSAKQFLFPPTLRLWRASRKDGTFQVVDEGEPIEKVALIGLRPCEIHAIAIQDRVFMGGKYVDPAYAQRRESLFVVAVNCAEPGGTCFCVSMGTGPKASRGFDLALTEIIDESGHRFLVEIGSEEGAEVMSAVECVSAEDTDRAAAAAISTSAAARMGRSMETTGIRNLLFSNLEHPRWDDVASRCLGCANCTMVCPTCFCSTVDEVSDLAGEETERVRHWDSCFTVDHSYIHGGSIRVSGKSRYRQWMTHKLASWWDQFDTSGCVGCGRCITWCPVGIDITAEVRAIRESPMPVPKETDHADNS